MRLGPKTKQFLELTLLFGAEALLAGLDMRSLIRQGAGLAPSRSFDRAVKVAETQGWVKRHAEGAEGEGWVWQLTEMGREELLDGIDPESAWRSPWDGLWRTVSFDIPANHRAERHQMDAWLAKRRFGHLQGSLWLTHRGYEDWSAELEGRRVDPRFVVFQESRFIGRMKDSDFVKAAWDWAEIDLRYERYLRFLQKQGDRGEGFAAWHRSEAQLWTEAFALDPFLPEALLPPGYRGKTAWRRRREAYLEVARIEGAESPVGDVFR